MGGRIYSDEGNSLLNLSGFICYELEKKKNWDQNTSAHIWESKLFSELFINCSHFSLPLHCHPLLFQKCSHCAPSSFSRGLFVQTSGATSSKKSSLTTYLNPDPHIFPSATSPQFSDFFLTHYSVSSIQSLKCIWLFATPWTAARQASLSMTNSWSLLKLMSMSRWCHPAISASVVPFSSCLQSFPASGSFPISWFFAADGQRISFSYSISPSSEYSGLISFRMD